MKHRPSLCVIPLILCSHFLLLAEETRISGFSLRRELRELERLFAEDYPTFEDRLLSFLAHEETFNLDFERHLSYMVLNQATSPNGQIRLMSYLLTPHTTFQTYRTILQVRRSGGVIDVVTLDELNDAEALHVAKLNFRYIDEIRGNGNRRLYLLTGSSPGGRDETRQQRISCFWVIEATPGGIRNLNAFNTGYALVTTYLETDAYENRVAFDRDTQRIFLHFCNRNYWFNRNGGEIERFISESELYFEKGKFLPYH